MYQNGYSSLMARFQGKDLSGAGCSRFILYDLSPIDDHNLAVHFSECDDILLEINSGVEGHEVVVPKNDFGVESRNEVQLHVDLTWLRRITCLEIQLSLYCSRRDGRTNS